MEEWRRERNSSKLVWCDISTAKLAKVEASAWLWEFFVVVVGALLRQSSVAVCCRQRKLILSRICHQWIGNTFLMLNQWSFKAGCCIVRRKNNVLVVNLVGLPIHQWCLNMFWQIGDATEAIWILILTCQGQSLVEDRWNTPNWRILYYTDQRWILFLLGFTGKENCTHNKS